jgi:hypothetical protein
MGELPKLFGKAFAVGFLLPSAAFALALGGMLSLFDTISGSLAKLFTIDLVGVTTAIAFLWFGAVALMALNRPLVRLLEGYGKLNPARCFEEREKRRYSDLSEKLNQLDNQILAATDAGRAADPALTAERTKILLQLAAEFPDQAQYVLPTRFGNVLRAFEVYPRVVYGLEAIQGWSRLAGVIPADFKAQIDDAKSQTDFWVNIWFLSLLLFGIYAGLCIDRGHLLHRWIPILALIVALCAPAFANSMAREWGELVKSAFDLFRGELAESLGLELPRSIEHERSMWAAFSQTAIYRSRDAADLLGPYRAERKSKDV